jgi:osmoprotectant transport system substrate-binding protein
MSRASQVRTMVAVAAATLSFGAAACGGGERETVGGDRPGVGKPPVTLGSKNFTEQFVLGQLYKQALEAKGYRVTLKNNIGSSEIVDKALTSGRIQAYPEYTGTILTAIAHRQRPPLTAEEAYQQAKRFEESRGFTLTEATPFFNTDAVAVLRSYAERNQLEEITDLGKLGSKVTLGAPPEFRTRYLGDLRRMYGLSALKFRPLAIGLQYPALDSGRIQAGTVFTTDGQLSGDKYTVLRDPKNLFGFQNVAMVVSSRVLAAEGPAFAQTIDAVSAKLTTEAMREMNAAADLNKVPPAEVARKFLQANGLL